MNDIFLKNKLCGYVTEKERFSKTLKYTECIFFLEIDEYYYSEYGEEYGDDEYYYEEELDENEYTYDDDNSGPNAAIKASPTAPPPQPKVQNSISKLIVHFSARRLP